MTTYSRSTVALPQSYVLGDVLQWNATGFSTAGVVDQLLTTNIDGTLTRVTGSGFALDAAHVPTAGTVTKIERLASDGVTLLETFSSLAPSYSLLNVYYGSFGTFTSAIFSGDDTLTGSTADDTLFGGLGNDTINSGGGADTIGGDGGNNIVNAGAGDDTIISYGTDKIDGGIGNDSITLYASVFAGAPVTINLSNADQLLALGNGLGTLIHVEAVQFTADMGNDTLTASNSLAGVSANMLHGAAGNDRLSASANGASLFGEAGNDLLTGAAGVDHLDGGSGNDTYVLGAGADLVNDAEGGVDSIISTVSRKLSDYSGIENLILQGTTASNGTGNSGVNRITGSAGNNVLDGGPDSVFDVLIGGLGNDTYVLGRVADTIIETASQGTDTIVSLWHRSLNITAYGAIENLTLSGSAGFSGTGNKLANAITGNAGSNVLDGGQGNDILTGGLGKDSFRFDTMLSTATNVDRITDFSVPDDTIQLKKLGADLFNALTVGRALAGAFHLNTTGLATEADDRIVYNSANGKLYYDADGNGAAVSIQFATLSVHLALTAADFLVF